MRKRQFSGRKLRLLKLREDYILQKGSKNDLSGFPGGAVVKNLPANVGNMGLSPGPGRSYMPRNN